MNFKTIVIVLLSVAVVAGVYRGITLRQRCDKVGNLCCGPDNEVKTDHCHQGLGCNIATRLCESCGAPGQPCCDGDYSGFSMKGYSGILLDSKERIESCNLGASCDARLAPEGGSWLGTRICQACGASEGGSCCSPDVRYALGRCFEDARSKHRLVCDDPWRGASGRCVQCGHVAGAKACQSGFPCDEGMVEANGVCVQCGFPGYPTCDRGEPCRDQSVPNRSYSMCVSAGGPNQPCLKNNRCSYGGLFCNAAKICEPCGDGGQVCCPAQIARECRIGQCREGRCFACGYENMPVCEGSEPCPHSGEPVGGACVPCGRQNQRCCYGLSIVCENGMRCEDGNCKGQNNNGNPNNEQWKTCSGQPWSWSTIRRSVFIEDDNGCITTIDFTASSPEEALQCARVQYGEGVVGTTVEAFSFAISCPNTGCNQITYSARNHSQAKSCAEASWKNCEVEDGGCS